MTAAEVTPPATDSAERIGRYEVISEIARGGMATVYLAHLGGLGGFRRLVAIKRLHPHLASEPQFVSMFLDEARLVAETFTDAEALACSLENPETCEACQ